MEEANNTQKKPKFTFTWKALTVLVILLIFYTLYHVVSGSVESLNTTPAGLVEQSSTIMLDGVVFRDEEGITTNYKGDMRPYYYNGERASVDSAVAAVYSKRGNSDANAKIAELEAQLEILKKSNVKGLVSIVDIEGIQNEINTLYATMMLALSDGDYLRASRLEADMLIAMNKLAIYRGDVKNYNSEIEKIEAELENLYSSFSGDKAYIFADKGGYFYHSCDGYEDSLTLSVLDSLTVEALAELTEGVKNTPTRDSGYTAKFVYNNVWHIATLCDNATAEALNVGTTYNVMLFDYRERNLKLTLEKVGSSDGEKSVLIFACSDMPEGFDFTRYQEFRLEISSIEGYRVPKEAIRTIKDEQTGEDKMGVYVLNTSIIEFKRVEIIGESDGYYIVSKLDRSKDNYREYLNLNDLIVLDTRGIYEGKVLK